MDKKEWLNRSIDERLQWYLSEIDQLIDYLSDEKTIDENKLQEIKKRMIFDGTPSENRMNDESEEEKNYYKSVYKAYKALPNIKTDRDDWEDKLSEAKEILHDS